MKTFWDGKTAPAKEVDEGLSALLRACPYPIVLVLLMDFSDCARHVDRTSAVENEMLKEVPRKDIKECEQSK